MDKLFVSKGVQDCKKHIYGAFILVMLALFT